MDIFRVIRFDDRLTRVVELLESVDRPGDFCADGRLFAPMPRISVGGGPGLSFPIPAAQAETLIAAADRAPYGRGQQTLVDAAVRNSWQLAPRRLRVDGTTWEKTLGEIVGRSAEGLGFPAATISARLYKMLVYEPGGFFLPHRDTEKADGMVATLVITLPTAGVGGELVVRHHGREKVIPMQTAEPSELVHAAFYADCEHEVRPVTEGHRICLVYNLIRRKDAGVAASAPDHREVVVPLAGELGERLRESDPGGKLVWVLEHDYSEAGFAFDNLKNVDAAVAEVMVRAAGEADCAVFAAILHAGATDLVTSYLDAFEHDDPDEDDFEVVLTDDFHCWLDGWKRPDGTAADYGELPLCPGELMPAERLDLTRPDSQRLTEAMGNGGATVERLYRGAALVVWPREATLRVIAPAGAKTILRFLAAERHSELAGASIATRTRELAEQIAAVWPEPVSISPPDTEWLRQTVAAVEWLRAVGNREATLGFLTRIVLPRYRSGFDEALLAAAADLGAGRMRGFLVDLVGRQLSNDPSAVLELLRRLNERFDDRSDPAWRDALAETVRTLCASMTTVGERDPDAAPPGRRQAITLSSGDLVNFFGLVWKCDLEDATAEATAALIARPELATPDRTLPDLVEELRSKWPDIAAGSPAFGALWERAAAFLVARSSRPPTPPADWTLPTDCLGCHCEQCAALRAFCADPRATEHRVRARQGIRDHLTDRIDRSGLDLRHETDKRRRPYTLAVFKTRAAHERRLAEYEADVAAMRKLVAAADAAAASEPRAAELAAAVAAG